jgi:plastocyanin domain-containing protein
MNGGSQMNKSAAAIIGTIVIVNACIWGFVILMSSHTLSGTGAYQEIQNILSGGAAASLVVVGGGFAGLLSSLKTKK